MPVLVRKICHLLLVLGHVLLVPCYAPDEGELPKFLRDLLNNIPEAEPSTPATVSPRTALTTKKSGLLMWLRGDIRGAMDSYERYRAFGREQDLEQAKQYAESAKQHREAADFTEHLLQEFNAGKLTNEAVWEFVSRNNVPEGYTAPVYFSPTPAEIKCADRFGQIARNARDVPP